MAEQDNVGRVQEIYAAFRRGDIAAILNAMDDDVEWIIAGPSTVAYTGSRRGREQVAQFFAALDDSVHVERFEPREFVAQGDQVVALGSWQGRVRANGRRFDSDWAMVWLWREGRVVQLRSYEDTARVVSAFGAVRATGDTAIVPAVERDMFRILVQDAIELARDGDAADGYEVLLAGLCRAERARDDSEPWADALVVCYRDALERFVSLHQVGRA